MKANNKLGKSTSQQLLKSINQQKVLNLIFSEGPITRVELAEKTGLTKQTVTNIVNRLLQEQIVLEGEPVSGRSGRNPIPLTVNYGAMYAIGVEVAVKYVRGKLMNFNNRVIAETALEDLRFTSEEQTLECIRQVIDELLRRVPHSTGLKGIGISIQGLVDSKAGVVISSSWLKWKNYPMRDKLQQLYPFPVYVENDVNLLAQFENLQGRLAASRHNITLKLDYGIGGAIIIDKQLYSGATHVAGEFGHYKAFRIPYSHRCHCGAFGCLTTLASISGLRNNVGISLEEFNLRVRNADTDMIRLFDEIQDAVGLALSNIVTFFNPDHVLLTGKIVGVLGDLLVPEIERRLFSTVPEAYRSVVLLHSRESVDDPAMAAALVKKHFFEVPLDSLSL